MWRDAWLIAGKDLRIELRSNVARNQVLPFAIAALLLFGLALGPDPERLRSAAPGLFWVTVLFATILAIQRSFSLERRDDALDGLRISGADPGGIFLGKSGALVVELAVLELLLALVATIVFRIPLANGAFLAVSALVATGGLAAVGVLYGILSSNSSVHETLLPLLFLPVAAPVLLGAVKTWQLGIAQHPGAGLGWFALLCAFSAIYLAIGTVAFGTLLEDG
ncbi:MAG TPA: heme exporter protein CcmB [Acidimicrobiales bacterium]|jgi:heme exporter protein B|nr:heme exporter protein CcmB [Acidimicrobiales bacterium]